MHKKKLIVLSLAIMLLFTNLVSASSRDDISRDFFIDPYTGETNCRIVVGQNAAASDAMSAAWIAAQIGTMSYYEEYKETYTSDIMMFYSKEQTYHKKTSSTGTSDETNTQSYIDSSYSGSLNIKALIPYQPQSEPLWDYDIYVDPYSDFGDSTNWLKDTGFSFETISLDLSVRDTINNQTIIDLSEPATIQRNVSKESLDLETTQTYPAIYPRHYWGTESDITAYDPLGGLEYRTIVYGLREPIEARELPGIIMTKELVTILREGVAEDLYIYYGDVFFLGNMYNCLEFGTDEDGYDYMLYGTPKWEEAEMQAGESHDLINGWTVTIAKIDIYNASVSLLISDSDKSKIVDVPEGQSLIITEDLLPGVSPTILCVYPEKISIKDSLTVTCIFYALNDYGCLKETIYGIDAPFSINNGMEWHLDIVPCDSIQERDLDNDPVLFEEGNPSFDVSDKLKVYSSAIDDEVCVPYLELWLATSVEPEGNAIDISFTQEDGKEYFHVDIMDNVSTDLTIDDHIIIGRTIKNSQTIRHYTDIDSSNLAIRDVQVNVDIKSDYNLILVGGPVVNSMVNELIILGITTMEYWTSSYGEYVVFNDAFVNGKDVIVVAGRDRDATNKATKSLLNLMTALE
ncbi:MAG: S-layer protein [Candidatus Methanofastidiosa archaeon]|nr:S-layer protein [Candidatus Methanofastidiosa archaeon]